MRTADAIKSDIERAKARFDRAVFASPFYDRYSQASRLRQWESLQAALVPLVAELVAAEAAEAERERQSRIEAVQQELRQDVETYMQLKRQRRNKAA